MKRLILAGLATWTIAQAPAYALVADKFDCSIQLFAKDGSAGPRAAESLAALRVPEAANPYWIEGVSATTARTDMRLEANGIEVYYRLEYRSFHSVPANKGAQWTCLAGGYQLPDGPGTMALCSTPVIPTHSPYDPVTEQQFEETPLSGSGLPLFRSQDLRPKDTVIDDSPNWSRVHTECRYLGTFE